MTIYNPSWPTIPTLCRDFFFETSPTHAKNQRALLDKLDPCFIDQVHETHPDHLSLIQDAYLTTNIDNYMPPTGGCGFLNAVPDDDGMVRFTPLLIRQGGFYLPSLALAAAHNWLGSPKIQADIHPSGIDIVMGEQHFEASARGLIWPILYGATGTIPTYSAKMILSGELPPDTLKDKLVFVGISATGIDDIRATPVDHLMQGTELQAQISLALLHSDILQHPPAFLLIEALLMLLIGLLFGFFFQRSIEKTRGALTLLAITALLGIGYQLFLHGYWLHLMLPIMQIIITFSLLLFFFIGESLWKRQHMRDIFSTYIDANVVSEALSQGSTTLSLQGSERDMSVLFMDLEGFTPLSERLTPQEVVKVINAFFDIAIQVIHDQNGCVDRLTGDGLIALFGAPIANQHHAQQACEAAFQLEKALLAIEPTFKDVEHRLRVRVGINSGHMIVGNMGSSQRVQYTFMGDSGNVAARLESLNKQYGTHRMIGEATHAVIQDDYVCRKLDRVALKGKSNPMYVYELLGQKATFSGNMDLILGYEQALSTYLSGDFNAASKQFAQLAAEFDDEASLNMCWRCNALNQYAQEQWPGYWIAKNK